MILNKRIPPNLPPANADGERCEARPTIAFHDSQVRWNPVAGVPMCSACRNWWTQIETSKKTGADNA